MASKRTRITTKGHQFGGDWTTVKLDVLAAYLTKYAAALKDKPSPGNPFRKAFIDAFAGTGYRDARKEESSNSAVQHALFAEMAAQEPQALLDGSARRALQTQPPFDKYIFIERNAERCKHLEQLKLEFPQLAGAIEIRQGDANAQIQKLCSAGGWASRRAVLFLDPYGMQVEWPTIAAIAATRAIDLWLLFPLGMGLNRLLTKSGDIPESWRKRLNLLLGTEGWHDEFYKKVDASPNLFGEPQEHVIKAKMDIMARYFNDRLKTVFAGVAEEPGVLRNSFNNPLYLLCFAVGNESGRDIALRIANHLLKQLR